MITEQRAKELAIKIREVVFKGRDSVHVRLTYSPGYPSRKRSVAEGLQKLVVSNNCLDSHFTVINLDIPKKFLNRKTVKERDVALYIAHEFHHAKDIMSGKLKFNDKKIIYGGDEYKLRFNVNEKYYEYYRGDRTYYTVPWEDNYDLDEYAVRMVCGDAI